MFSSAEHQLIYKVANAPIHRYPYPHIYVEDVFPADFYRRLRGHLPPRASMTSLKKLGRVGPAYPDTRRVFPLTPDDVETLPQPYRDFWNDTGQWLLSGRFAQVLLSKFGSLLRQRFENPDGVRFNDEVMIVQDETNYALGPHTDGAYKVLSLLFYLPEDGAKSHLGTSIYLPKDPSFTCPGTKHHPFDGFERLMTMPYVPNALFGFLKTIDSFHGVEKIHEERVRRDLMLYDITVTEAPKAPAPAQTGAQPAVKFTF